MKKWITGFVAVALLSWCSITSVNAAMVTVAWDAVEDTQLAGYKIYIGRSAGAYDNVYDVGNVTQHTLNVPVGSNYIVATAYAVPDAEGNVYESEFSNEVNAVVRIGKPTNARKLE